MEEARILSVRPYLSGEIRRKIERIALSDRLEIEEIRLRAGLPRTLGLCGESCFITPT